MKIELGPEKNAGYQFCRILFVNLKKMWILSFYLWDEYRFISRKSELWKSNDECKIESALFFPVTYIKFKILLSWKIQILILIDSVKNLINFYRL